MREMSFKWLLLGCVKVIEPSKVIIEELCEKCQYFFSCLVSLLQFELLSSDTIQIYRSLVTTMRFAIKQQLQANSIKDTIV